MAKVNARLDMARTAYREALEAARAHPTPEAWAKLLSAGKELSAAADGPRRSLRGRRPGSATPAEEHADDAPGVE